MQVLSPSRLGFVAALGVLSARASAQCPAWKTGFTANGTGDRVQALTVGDLGSGPRLFAGGDFFQAGGVPADHVASWDGTAWAPLGLGTSHSVSALGMHDDGTGAALYAGGVFYSAGGSSAAAVARWDGTSWSPLGSGLGGGLVGPYAEAFASADLGSGPTLFVAGQFGTAGGVFAWNAAAWDGAAWSGLGNGLSGHQGFEHVRALLAWDDGAGMAVYAGGYFNNPGDAVAKWDGTTWSPVGPPAGAFSTNVVGSLAVFDDGNGPSLYAGGFFADLGGAPVANLARFDGAGWVGVGGGTDGYVSALRVFDDGSGSALYAAGSFAHAGGVPANRIAKWNGTTWSALASGADADVLALASFVDATGESLYVGGDLTATGGIPAAHLGAWGGCQGNGAGTPFCYGDGSSGPCPCGNTGNMRRGCQNSAATGGSKLVGSGGARLGADTFVLSATSELASAFSLFLQGDVDLGAPLNFGDGLRCVGGNLKRLFAHNAAGGAVSAPTGGDLSVHARSAALGDPISAGETRSYLMYYRDPDPTFCAAPMGSTFNASHSLRILWIP